jgi:hypothetical protein
LTKSPKFSDVTASAVLCLSNLASCVVGNQEICEHGIVPLLLSTLREHEGTVIRRCGSSAPCETVWSLALRRETIPELLRLNALDIVCDTMTAYPDDAEVAEYGLLAIGLIAVSGSAGSVEVMIASGAVERVHAAVARFPDNSVLQTLSSAILAKVYAA